MNDEEILKIISAELSDSVGGSENDSIDAQRREAYSDYLGDKGDVEDYKSSVVSTDVADAIEWIMPEIVKAFTQNNEVVTFDPVGPNDTRQAELESRYVYDVLMKDNDGFIIIHEFIKDALMQKNGFLKACYEEVDEIEYQSYTGITEPELLLFNSDDSIEITGMSTYYSQNIPLYDINIERKVTNGRIDVRCVAPENYRVNRMHNSVSLTNARFQAETMLKTRTELLNDGFDPDIIDEMAPSSLEHNDNRSYRFSMQGETTNTGGANSIDETQELFEVSECYMLMDIDSDGIAKKCKITVAGYDNPSHVLDVEEVDSWPFISATAILMSHKLFGLSIHDRLKEIQNQKTALWRNILDNMYLQNNQRTVVIEGQVNLDDLLVSRPGGVIRAKTPNAVAPYQTPALPSDAYRMMDYLDTVAAGRSGVSPEGSIHDTAMGDNVGSEGLEKLLNQKEELVGLMVRVFAETGMKPLCNKIRSLLIKHKDTTEDYEFHGEWVKIDPRCWKTRKNSTVRVGTGSGNRKQQQAAISQVLSFQEKVLANPSQSLVTEKQVYTAINDFVKFSGIPGASNYFLDPESPEGQENKKKVEEGNAQKQQAELKEKQILTEAQAKIAEAETSKAKAAEQSVILRSENERTKQQLEAFKQQSSDQINLLKQELEEAKTLLSAKQKDDDLEFKYYDANQRAAIERQRIAASESNTKQSGDDSDR